MVIDVKQSLSSLYRYFNVPKEFSSQLSSMKLPHLNSENLPGWTALALSRKYAKKLAGHNVEDAAFVRQWVEYAVTQGVHADDSTSSSQVLKEVNKALADQSYIAANYLTVADLFLFYVLHPIVASMTFYEKEKYINLSRWFDHLQLEPNIRQTRPLVTFSRTLLYS
nr:PREDICTED: eukaryotic translation elongation factor 1 epsilon-1 isoform X1 [Bemisia tabaci]